MWLGGAALLLAHTGQAQAPVRAAAPVPEAPSDDQSFRREIIFGVNFNTQGGLIGGVTFRSSRVITDRWLRFWSLEGVSLKNPKEQRVTNNLGGSYVRNKTNYGLVLRPSFGMQRVLFRKAPDAGVQVNGLLSAGPSLGLLMPYYISYDYTPRSSGGVLPTDDIRDEQFDPQKHSNEANIVDSAPLFSGIGGTQVVPGFHLRGGLSFEFGRYHDALAGAEAGFLLEGYTKRLLILDPGSFGDINALNHQFFPSVYLTLYLGHRS